MSRHRNWKPRHSNTSYGSTRGGCRGMQMETAAFKSRRIYARWKPRHASWMPRHASRKPEFQVCRTVEAAACFLEAAAYGIKFWPFIANEPRMPRHAFLKTAACEERLGISSFSPSSHLMHKTILTLCVITFIN